VRYGSVLQRRLGKLESTIKVLSPQEVWDQIQVEALTRMSTEDLRALRVIVHKRAEGIAIEDTPENNAVIERTNAIIAEAQAGYYAPVTKGRANL
jgi:hypothetical protein